MYYITKDNANGTRETVATIDGTIDQAQAAFLAIIKEQSYEYHIAKTMGQWRIIRLFDENYNQIAQES